MRMCHFSRHVVMSNFAGELESSSFFSHRQSVTMRVQLLLAAVLRAALVESLVEVWGYVGDNVTLPSGADPSWKLSKVEWSVFSNNTWIATYQKGKVVTERFYLYKGRLRLNKSSGDLMIHNLNRNDAMEYTVDLISAEGEDSGNKVMLTVRQHLQKPTIKTIPSTSINGTCWILLQCSSADDGVNFTWQVEPPGATGFTAADRNLFQFLNTTQKTVKITCTSSRGAEQASSGTTLSCDDEESQHRSRRGCYISSFMGGLVGVSLTVILVQYFRSKRKNINESKV